MKKMIFCIIPLIMVFMGCASSETAVVETNRNSPGMDLDVAIREAAAQMGENLPGGTKVALVSVASSSAQLSEYVISRLEAALVSGKNLVVVDRANLDKVREEQGFQASGEVDDDSAKSIGKLLGAGAIVTGAFADLGDVYSLTLKAINIETATVAVSYPADIAKSTRIGTLLASGGGVGTGTRTARTGGSVPSAVPPVPATPAYKIGDTGPAGGLIFYDKGNNSGGWRYLEAAPANTERTLPNFVSFRVANDKRVGAGKENTRTFMVVINREGGGVNTAPWYCDQLVVNGYDDWYLPAEDELLYVYNVLASNGLGDFQGREYWASNESEATYIQRHTVDFSNGRVITYMYTSSPPCQVRAVRRF
ncbi:MAG: hypothetical protein LBK13_06615 [Spirochaetales bacterium]|jgi:hypothetical protein|nr:hypothetical protein [Spirochaetales bacterium]